VTCGLGTELKDGVCVPSGGGTPDIKCGPGLEKVNNVCQLPTTSLTCGPGTVEVDRVCVADENNGGNGIKCGPGTVLEGTKCVVGVKNPAQPITCGPGTKKEGDKCVPDGSGATITCSPPLVLEGKECVQATKVTCGPGTVQVDNVCVADANNGGNGIVCGPGTFLQGTTCVVGPKQNGIPLTCGPGTKKEGDKCVPDGSGAAILCGPDTIQQGNACVPKPKEVTCGPGTVEVDKVCVAAPGSGGNGVTCGPDTVLQGNTCVPGSKPPASQPLQCGPGTAEVSGVCTPNGSDGSISCGPGAVLEGKQCVTALVCGPGTREVDRVCVPDAQNGGNDVSCGPGTVLFGVTCILGDKPDPKTPLSCGVETQPVDDICKPTGNGGAITCGQGTKLEGKLCVPVSTDADPLNCGKVGNVCPGGNGTPTCIAGVCGIKCNEGFGNCDGNLANGCETSTASNDVSNCGGCGVVCPGGANSSATCTGGVCGIACQPGFGNCDGQASNGCEANTGSSILNCGGCGIACPQGFNGEKSTCNDGVCGLICPEGFANCDGNPANGCEVNLNTDSLNCGSCGRDCGGGTCSQGGVCSGVTLYVGLLETGLFYSPYFHMSSSGKIHFVASSFDRYEGDVEGTSAKKLPLEKYATGGTPYTGFAASEDLRFHSIDGGNGYLKPQVCDLLLGTCNEHPIATISIAIKNGRFYYLNHINPLNSLYSSDFDGQNVVAHIGYTLGQKDPAWRIHDPDVSGNYISFYDYDEGSVHIHDLSKNETKAVMPPTAAWPSFVGVRGGLLWVAYSDGPANNPTVTVYSMKPDGTDKKNHPALEGLGIPIRGLTVSEDGIVYTTAAGGYHQGAFAYEPSKSKAYRIGSGLTGRTVHVFGKWLIGSGNNSIVRVPRLGLPLEVLL
jgi:hypothetical protein